MNKQHLFDLIKKNQTKVSKSLGDVGNDEAQRFINNFSLKAGNNKVFFSILYYMYMNWRIEEEKKFISRYEFGKLLKRHLKAGFKKKQNIQYRVYLLDGDPGSQDVEIAAWRQLFYEKAQKNKKTKKTRKSRPII